MSVVCEEVFDDVSNPSIEEIRDYAVRIGIDPKDEPQLLPLAAEGLMKALPPTWKACLNEKTMSYYYYNRTTGKTQWEHPLDDLYRNKVKKARIDSQSLSLGEPTDDATYARDELPSLEEPPLPITPTLPKTLEPLFPIGKIKSSSPRRLTRSPTFDLNISPRHESKFVKQKSEDHILINKKFSINPLSSRNDDHLDNETKVVDSKSELKVSGGGSMFLKSNTKKIDELKDITRVISDDKLVERKSFLRDHSLDLIKDLQNDFDERDRAVSITQSEELVEKGDPEDEDKKSVRFNLRENQQINLSDKSISEEEDEEDDDDDSSSDKNIINPVLQVSLAPQPSFKSPFTLAIQNEVFDKPPIPKKKIVKPNTGDFIKPKLIRTNSSDSEENLLPGRIKRLTMEEIDLDSENSQDSPTEKLTKKTKLLEQKLERRVDQLKKKMWKTKNEELVEFQDNLEDSQREELKRIMTRENEMHEKKVADELKCLRSEIEKKNDEIIEEEKSKLSDKLKMMKLELSTNFDKEAIESKESFDLKKEELEKYYEEKLAEIETNLAENMEKNRDEIITTHNTILEQLKQNNALTLDEMKKEFKLEEEQLKRIHKTKLEELKKTYQSKELNNEKTDSKCDRDESFEKLTSEKRLLEDKYKCLKEKYIKLKTDIRLTIEKRNKKKEEGRSGGTVTTGSETERSFSGNKDRLPTQSSSQRSQDKPPTLHPPKPKTEEIGPKDVSPNDLDTSISDRSEDRNKNDYDTSENSLSHRRSRRKLFSRMKSNSTPRVKATKNPTAERSCSPVENLRRQLQKLEDLEDEFPQNQQSDTYHLRYPFSDAHKFEGSTELEFFRHKIHLERDSIKRAKESLRSQKLLFQQRQKELKLKHGTMARHTYQQLCQEEKELTDMEVSLHRTRSLLGEKVIRLRHLEQTLQRATVPNESKYDDATLSDLSSHSASSGISSTEFAAIDVQFGKSLFKDDSFQEPSEIIQSLENLNSEIKEIWEVLRKQQQQHAGASAAIIPPFVYPDLGWPVLAGAAATLPAPPSIPTLADRLNNYRQHIALAKAQSTMVTHAVNQGATTTLVERTRNLRHWLKQAGIENNGETSNPQADL